MYTGAAPRSGPIFHNQRVQLPLLPAGFFYFSVTVRVPEDEL